MRPALVLWAALAALATLGGGTASAAPPKIIVHPDVAQNTLSRSSLRAIFGMRLRKWQDGTPVRVFVLATDHPDHAAFAKEVLHVYPHQLRQAWDRLVYSGTGQAPNEVATPREMLLRVMETPGAIGYLDSENPDERVHVLDIE